MQLVGVLNTAPARAMVAYVNMDFFNAFDGMNVLQAVGEGSRRRGGYAASRRGQFAPFEEALHGFARLSIQEMRKANALDRERQ